MLRFIQEVNTTTRSCALWDLEEETDYIVHVQSISMSGTSPLSEPLRFRTPKEAETQASKSKGKRAHGNTTSNISNAQDLHTFLLWLCPFQDSECGEDLAFWQHCDWFLSKDPIKINRHTKREMKCHDRVLLKLAPADHHSGIKRLRGCIPHCVLMCLVGPHPACTQHNCAINQNKKRHLSDTR